VTHDDVLRGFGEQADAYERGRPGYPPAAVEWLARRLGLGDETTVVDLAAGTGKLTRQLVALGAHVVAVEPSEGMRAVLARVVPDAEAVDGRAEAIPLPDGAADAVTVGQAFHWFANADALAEIARVLRRGGGLGLLWNVRDPDDPLGQALRDLVDPLRPPAHFHAAETWPDAIAASPHFGPLEQTEIPHVERVDAERVADRVGSISFVATHPERERLLARVRALVGPGEVELAYRTRAYVTRAGAGRQ